MFASKGPIEGTVLSQLVFKAIMLLEQVGVFIDALACDGAVMSRAIRKQFSVCGALEGLVSQFYRSLKNKSMPRSTLDNHRSAAY